MFDTRTDCGYDLELGANWRLHRYGVVEDTAMSPDFSRMGRESSVESLWIKVFPNLIAERARAAVSAR